jgi:hypothetical protein
VNPTAAYRAAGADPADGPGSGPEDPRVLGALEEYLAALEAGQAPGRREFLAATPPSPSGWATTSTAWS